MKLPRTFCTLGVSLWLGVGGLTSCARDNVSPTQGSGGDALTSTDQVVASATVVPTTIRGVDFHVKTELDQTFCVEVESGTTEGRALSLQTCGANDNQRWTFPLYGDATNILVESEGLCVNGHFDKATAGAALTVVACGSGDDWRFVYTAQGAILNVRNKKCLQVPGAASNAVVTMADCDATKLSQQWLIEH